ncbi:pyruvate formate lyase family protein [Ruthenibacterium lactatiformans]|uniref:pyruvate formate lyase family protein n=1 Tax=Ruthenibacterium lactatiformans TaxID=1550024 RepID=UPI0026659730|nr:pyruvate formate lyase family protein [Ruthenibacterium lactatiformans]
MNHWKVQNPRQDLSYEIAFTQAYRAALKRYTHPAEIELAMLRAQYPAIMHPIEDNDVLAGRVEFGLVGYGIQGQTGGTGYYIDEPRVVQALEFAEGNAKYREDLHDMLTFWKARNTYNKVLRETPAELRAAIPTEQWKTEPVAASPIIRMAGAYIDFDKLVRVGVPGLRAELTALLDTAPAAGRDEVLLRCALGALDVLCGMLRFYETQAREKAADAPTPARRKEMEDLAAALHELPERAPTSLLAAMQLCWLYGVMCPLVEFGRMDEYLGDLYCHDIDNGVITEAQALKMAQTYFYLIDALDDETDGRVIVGGYGRRNPENADRYCLVACEACRTVKEILPQFTLRFNKETPKAVWDAAMRCIGEGRTFPLLYNDEVLVPGVMKAFGVDRARAETYMPLGCGEIEFDHYSFGSPNGSVGTLKILELAVRGGYDPIAGGYLAPKTIPLAECKSYEQFLENYKTLLHYFIAAQAHYEKYLYESIGQMHPFLMVSMLYDGCMEGGKALLNGGCRYLAGTMELYGNVNAANSLAVIKKLVFEEKTVSAQELVQAMDDNFVGHERLRRMVLDVPKYGNDIAYVDDIMVELHDWLCETTAAQADKVGLKSYLCVNINNAQNTTLGRWVGATPDGRKAGTPMANANNPAPGTDKNGLTAMLNSILKLRHDNHAGMVQNMRFTRETWYNPDGKARALVDDYFARGGAHAMITVVGREDLAKAMEHPEDYHDLIVRIGGLSARFVALKKDVQQEIYNRVSY